MKYSGHTMSSSDEIPEWDVFFSLSKHVYNYFSERALLENATNFEQNPKSMAKIFKFLKNKRLRLRSHEAKTLEKACFLTL